MDQRRNLVPIELRQRIGARKVMMNWGLVCGFIVGLVLLDLAWMVLQIRMVRDQVAIARAEVLPIQELVASNAVSVSQRQASERSLSYLRSVFPDDTPIQILGAVTQAARGKLSELDDNSENADSVTQRIATLESINLVLPFEGLVSSEPRLEIRARTANDGATVNFVDNLRASDWLADVTLKASGRNPNEESRFVHILATPFNSGIKEP